ncbi:hypothetical protein [Stappia indica]|uniref:hypothetical protein n=1 Tax=Stappia indica TaxID=538381 RepID=UPI0008344BF2|nr:hypothetical protein [Stappia indica]
MIRQLPSPALCVPALALLLAAPAAAQTIYLGEHEVDTADRGAVRAAIERCATLAAAAPGAQQAATFTRGSATPEASPRTSGGEQIPQDDATPQPSNAAPAAPAEEQQSSSEEPPTAEAPVDRGALSLSVDALASSGEGSVASGDGGGSGTRPPGRSSESGESGEGGSQAEAGEDGGDDETMASVTLQACKEAGLVY